MPLSEWKKVDNGKCRKCGASDLWCYEWESSDGAHEDTHYQCRACQFDWWIEGSDA
jgi:hypothetical protein